MSLEQHLREVLVEQAERCLVPPSDVIGMVAGGTIRRRRSRRLVTLAAAAAVILATVSGIAAWKTPMVNRAGEVADQSAQSDCLAPGEVPSYSTATREVPDFIGGPVVNPERADRPCRVVLRKYLHNGPPSWAALTGKVWLFSDGRVIGWSDATDGLMEQRLNAGGVQRVLTMAVDHLSEVRVDPWASARYCRRAGFPGHECAGIVPYQGRAHWISDYHELADRLFDLSWLPDGAWVRQEPQHYAPTWWTACYGGRAPLDGETWSGSHPVDRQRVLDLLPDAAVAALRDKDTTTVPIRWGDVNGRGETTQYCTTVSATEHQMVSEALNHRGSAATREGIPLGRIDDFPAELIFVPLLPTGEAPCFCG